MRPIFLKIAGLHSFEKEQQIDFENLCDMGVFGIFGPTGSGKSTILDAITLALFGKVERAKNGTFGIINQNSDEAFVSFSFSLGTREFTAERSFTNTKLGGVQTKNSRLLEKKDDDFLVLADKKSEMDKIIENIIGLNNEDFTRAVVLPQGKFADFLNLQGAERRKMLQRIFSLEKYGEQLSKTIREEHSLKKQSLETKELLKEQLGDASDESLKLKKEEFEKTKEKSQILSEKSEELSKNYELAKRIIEIKLEKKEKEKDLNVLIEKEEFINKAEKRWKNFILAEKVVPLLDSLEKEKTDKAIEVKRKEELEVLFEEAKQELELLSKKNKEVMEKEKKKKNENTQLLYIIDDLIEKYLILEKDRQNLESLREELKKEEYEASKLKETYLDSQEKSEEFKNSLESLNRELLDLEQKLSREEDVLKAKEISDRFKYLTLEENEKKKELEEKEAKLEIISSNLEKVTILKKELILEEEKLDDELGKIEDTETRYSKLMSEDKTADRLGAFLDQDKKIWENLSSLKKVHDEVQEEILKLEREANKSEQDFFNKQKEVVELEEKLKSLLVEIEKNKEGHLLYKLKKELQKGKACPLCGSLEHEDIEMHEQEASDLTIAETERIKIEQKLEDEKMHLNKIKEELSKRENDLIFSERILKDKKEAIAKNKASLNFPTRKDLALKEEELEEKKKENLEEEKQIKLSIERRETLKKEEQILQEKKKNIENKFHALDSDYKILKSSVDNLRGFLVEKQPEIRKLKDSFLELKLGENLESFSSFFKEYKEIKTIVKDKHLEREKKSRLLDEKKEIVRNLEKKSIEKRNMIKQIDVQISHLEEKMREEEGYIQAKIADKNPLDYKEELLYENSLIDSRLIKQQEELDRKDEQVKNIFQSLKKTNDLIEDKVKRIEVVSKEYAEKVQELGLGSEDLKTYREMLSSKYNPDLEKKMIDDFRLKKNSLETAIKDLSERVGARNISFPDFKALEERKLRQEEELEEEKSNLSLLEYKLRQLRQANEKWNLLEKEIKVLAKEVDNLEILKNLFVGNAFVQFLAEEQLQLIVYEASEKLGKLTNYRYGLEIDSEGNFIIRDDANGGLKRPTSSLSGGETFLTSLALALSLSSQIQLRGKYPLEFFFLDEGFGTLDSYLLDTVMDALESLQSEDMAIGIISHVPELKMRLNRKLIVHPSEKGLRGTRLELNYT